MDMWEQGKHISLVQDIKLDKQRPGGKPKTIDNNQLARRFHTKYSTGRLQQVVQELLDGSSTSGPLHLDSLQPDGLTVQQHLELKHSLQKTPLIAIDIEKREVFEHYEDLLVFLPIKITKGIVLQAAHRISGAVGPSRVDAMDLSQWLTCHGQSSGVLQEEIALWAKWLGNNNIPWAFIQGLMACRLVPLDKEPGVQPIGIGETLRCLLAKCIIAAAGGQATAAAGDDNLCIGLKAGIKAAVHVFQDVMQDTIPEEAIIHPHNTQQQQRITQVVARQQANPEKNDIGCLQIDARNGFNELNRKSMLWTVQHLWLKGAKFAFNTYHCAAQLILQLSNGKAQVLASREGVTQGDPVSMLLYGIALVPLIQSLKIKHQRIIQAWFLDNATMVGSIDDLKAIFADLIKEGPQ